MLIIIVLYFKPLHFIYIYSLLLILQGKKPKKQDSLSLEEAIDDSENLTDFLMDFEEDK